MTHDVNSSLSPEEAFLRSNPNSPVIEGQVRENDSPFKLLQVVQENGVTTPAGLPVPFGSFYIAGSESVGDSVIFRPIAAKFKAIARDQDHKVISETGYHDQVSNKMEDTTGSYGCGRVFGKEAKALSADHQEINKKQADLYLDVFGLVSFVNEVSGKQLVKLRFRGGKMARWIEATSDVADPRLESFKMSTILPKNDPVLKAKGIKPGNGNYVNLQIARVTDRDLSLTDLMKDGTLVYKYIMDHNKVILEKYNNSKITTEAFELNDSLDDVM